MEFKWFLYAFLGAVALKKHIKTKKAVRFICAFRMKVLKKAYKNKENGPIYMLFPEQGFGGCI